MLHDPNYIVSSGADTRVLWGCFLDLINAIALGFVTARSFEAAVIVSLVAIRDWTFTLGPSLIPGFNALLLGYLLYRSGLVPRLIPMLGLIGAPLLIASATATLFPGNDLSGLPEVLHVSLGQPG